MKEIYIRITVIVDFQINYVNNKVCCEDRLVSTGTELTNGLWVERQEIGKIFYKNTEEIFILF